MEDQMKEIDRPEEQETKIKEPKKEYTEILNIKERIISFIVNEKYIVVGISEERGYYRLIVYTISDLKLVGKSPLLNHVPNCIVFGPNNLLACSTMKGAIIFKIEEDKLDLCSATENGPMEVSDIMCIAFREQTSEIFTGTRNGNICCFKINKTTRSKCEYIMGINNSPILSINIQSELTLEPVRNHEVICTCCNGDLELMTILKGDFNYLDVKNFDMNVYPDSIVISPSGNILIYRTHEGIFSIDRNKFKITKIERLPYFSYMYFLDEARIFLYSRNKITILNTKDYSILREIEMMEIVEEVSKFYNDSNNIYLLHKVCSNYKILKIEV